MKRIPNRRKKPAMQSPSLFTVVLDYRGGTYISQVEAQDVLGALRTWAQDLDHRPIFQFGLARKQDLIRRIAEDIEWGETPVLLDGLSNAWCTSVLFSGGIGQINIVKTAR